jgi:hypothetical protein
MFKLQSMFLTGRKGRPPAFSTFATILIIAVLILGGGGVTIAAAQSSQPGQLLYEVKVLSEDARLGLTVNPQIDYQLALEFTNRRTVEIQAEIQAGSPPSESVQIRYQNQIEQAIQFALLLPDDEVIQALAQIQTALQTQQQAFLHVQTNGSPQVDSILLRTQQMLQERLRWIEAGLTNPTQLRDQLRLRDQQRQEYRQGASTPERQATCLAPGTGGGNPWTTGTPTPGSGYGPGPGDGDCETCTPDSGNHAGPQPTQTQGNQPTQADPQPTQQPNQATQAGPQPTQQQNGQPTQAGSQPTQGSQPTASGPGSQPTPGPGDPGGKH